MNILNNNKIGLRHLFIEKKWIIDQISTLKNDIELCNAELNKSELSKADVQKNNAKKKWAYHKIIDLREQKIRLQNKINEKKSK